MTFYTTHTPTVMQRIPEPTVLVCDYCRQGSMFERWTHGCPNCGAPLPKYYLYQPRIIAQSTDDIAARANAEFMRMYYLDS